ncbi:hypothetical protein [Rhizosphaericola mali]|uniref:Chromosome partitioning protein ParA n=1 Tax=Rhizosphaericola mali TaxID=2545455 RepID=A0A5P2G9U7_9BACT|nr:hypothetical protein [Rhizosphaericola mali]QES90470.1 hypothetical protein E0W69_018015 [Rhizosphaericola mali]
MDSQNNPSNLSNSPVSNSPKPNDNRKLIWGILVVALLGTWGYLFYDKSKNESTLNTLQTQYSNVDSAKTAIQTEYQDALARMDSLTGSNVKLQGDLAGKQKEIEDLKSEIKRELSSKNADLSKAKSLIATLRGKIDNLLAEVDRLRAENQQLASSNEQLSTERDTLTNRNSSLHKNLDATTAEKNHIEDEASTLHASAFNISAIDQKKNGKESETAKAKKVDLLRISFVLDENRITKSGAKDLYLVVTGPDGNVVTIPSEGSGTFTTRQEGDKTFTTRINVNYEQGQRIPVTYDWHQNGKYQFGTYTIAVYNNGYKIGEGTKTLKKSGFLGL